MILSDFETITHGKWILAGEHAVIRGHAALVFPIREKELKLIYRNSTSELSADFHGEAGADLHLLFWSVLEQGIHLLGKSLNNLSGHFHLYNTIPIGVGMGASAALCVAMTRWFHAQHLLEEDDMHLFARELENLFHGKSSGLDIAGVAANTGTYFKQGKFSIIKQIWQPNWYLSSCGQIGMTSHCINQVQSLWEKDAETAAQIDIKMANSVQSACAALEQDTNDSGILLANAINSAADCFEKWGLVSESLQRHMTCLIEAGAKAVKPTGSGGGGYVISLWDEEPPSLDFELIKV